MADPKPPIPRELVYELAPPWKNRPEGQSPEELNEQRVREGTLPTKPGWGAPAEDVGICLSGGGIRSASFCLGALQGLTKANVLFGEQGASYLASVSGGSYIATALTMVSKGAISGVDAKDASKIITPSYSALDDAVDERPFAHGSPEEAYLRNHTLYLTHGKAGVAGVAWRVLLGVFLNLFLVALTIALVFVPLGWIYGAAWPSLRSGCPTDCPVSAPFAIPWWLWMVIGILGFLSIVVGSLWMSVRWRSDKERYLAGLVSGILIGSALGLLVFAVLVPWLIHLARPYYLTFNAPSEAPATKSATGAVTLTGLLAVLGGCIAAIRRLLSSSNSLEKRVIADAESGVKRYRSFFINVAATIAGPILVFAGIVTASYIGAGHPAGVSGAGWIEVFVIAGALIVWAFLMYKADVTAWSLFPMYRNRLSAGFVLRRIKRPRSDAPLPIAPVGDPPTTGDPWTSFAAEERPYGRHYKLSVCQPDDFPEVIICAAANVSDWGETPSGSNVTSFTFSSKCIGGPLVGAWPTEDYEQSLGEYAQSRFATLPSAMAISGAAFSPSMGRMTRAPFRFFMALANLRLGVWAPNPGRMEKFSNHNGQASFKLVARPYYLLFEMLGLNRLKRNFLYVTDGGHYENLGLVELLRRKCKTIWCIDASGDKVTTFSTLVGALRLAEAELGVKVSINPTGRMRPVANSDRPAQYVHQPFCVGTITYPDGEKGTLIHVKAGLPLDAPLELKTYAAANDHFPCDTTLDQLYDADRFDAYRSLGELCVTMASDAIDKNLPGAQPPPKH